jgi:hypothetical protein
LSFLPFLLQALTGQLRDEHHVYLPQDSYLEAGWTIAMGYLD